MSEPPADRGVYCNRTLNLRSIHAIGYDMDYTLVHYRVDAWEAEAFEHARGLLALKGWPVADLTFDPRSVIQGLVFDLELGNLVKATRFGYVIRAHHGGRALTFEELRAAYSGTFVDLSEPRWEFMNTLFSLSQASLFAQLVDLADAGALGEVISYEQLSRVLGEALDEAHTEGRLKARIMADPEAFVDLDPELATTLLDQRHAGKRLLLITNSDWTYTRSMMAYALDRFLPDTMTWRDLFDIVIVDAAKPRFFSDRLPVHRVVDEDAGLMTRHHGPLVSGAVHSGGDAAAVEATLGLSGSEILYLGDHLFGDVHVSKDMLRWRTGLILRELEGEIRALTDFRPREVELVTLMERKRAVDRRIARLRLDRLRRRDGYLPVEAEADAIERALHAAIAESSSLDGQIAPLARASGELGNPTWGLVLRAGSDKSLFVRQVERYADVYTSRVSNFGAETPYAYLRAGRGSLPHDPT